MNTDALTELALELEGHYRAERAGRDVDAPELITFIDALRAAEDELHALRRKVTADLSAEHARTKTTFQVDGIGAVEVGHQQVRTAWDKDRLLPQALARITDRPGVLADPDSGETHPPAVIAEKVYGELKRIVAFGAPKLPGLKALGFDPDEWCETRWETVLKFPTLAAR